MMGTEKNSRRLKHVQIQEPSSTTTGKKPSKMCQEEKVKGGPTGRKKSKLPPPLIKVEFTSYFEKAFQKEEVRVPGLTVVEPPCLVVRKENHRVCDEFDTPIDVQEGCKPSVEVTTNHEEPFTITTITSTGLQDANKTKVTNNGMMVLLEAAQHHTSEPPSTTAEEFNEDEYMPLYVTVTARCPPDSPGFQAHPALPESCDVVSSTVVSPSVIHSTLVTQEDEGPKLGNTLLVPEKKMKLEHVSKAVEATPCQINSNSPEAMHVTTLSDSAAALEPQPSWADRPLEDLSLAHAILDLSSPHRIPQNKRHLLVTSPMNGIANDAAEYMDLDVTSEEMAKDMAQTGSNLDFHDDHVESSPETPKDPASLMVYTYEEFFMSDGRSKKRVMETAGGLQANGKYKCNECGKFYATSSNLSRHKQTHRSLESGATRKCPTCGKAYVSMPALAMHILTHQLAHKCPICNKGFSRPWLLQGHLRSHTGERPYGCAHCGKAFADRSNLRAHMQMHSSVKSFHCHKCNKAFALKAYLNKHLESSCVKDGASSTGSSPGSSPEPTEEAKLLGNLLSPLN